MDRFNDAAGHPRPDGVLLSTDPFAELTGNRRTELEKLQREGS